MVGFCSVICYSQENEARGREDLDKSAIGREVEPGPSVPAGQALSGTSTLEGLCLDAHTQSEVLKRKDRTQASCPHLHEPLCSLQASQ